MAEVNDVDMSASQTENVKRLRETTNVHSDDAADDESSPKRPCDDRAKAALTFRAAQRPQIDLAALARASVAAAGASPGASTMCCALGPYGVRYVPKMGYAWKTVTAVDGTVQSVEYVPNEEPVAVIDYVPPDLKAPDDGKLAKEHVEAYLSRAGGYSNQYVGDILKACHVKGDIGGKPKNQAARDKRKKARQKRLDELLQTLTLAKLREKLPQLFDEEDKPEDLYLDGIEVAKRADVSAWPVMALIDGSLQVVHGPSNLTYCRFGSTNDAQTDGRYGASHQQLYSMLRGGYTNKSAALVVRFVGTPDRYDDESLKLGVDAGTVKIVRVAHEQQSHTTLLERLDKKQKNDEKRAEERKDKLAADAAYRAFVVRAVAKEHGIASPTVARPITVKGPFSEDQLKAFNEEGWASLPK